MKYAFMTYSCPDSTLDEALALAQRFGYDGIEPRTASSHRHGIEVEATARQRKEIRHKAAEAGIEVCCVATSHRLSDPSTAQAAVEEAVRSVGLAADVGSPVVRVFGGIFPESVSRQDATDQLVESLTRLADRNKGLPVTICVETHDHWCDPAHLAEAIRRVNRPNVGINWDLMHPVRTAKTTIESAFAAVRPWIHHVHFHDGVDAGGKLQLLPIGQGIVDHRLALKLLTGCGYRGYMSGEWIRWEPGEVHLPRELATMKAHERNLG